MNQLINEIKESLAAYKDQFSTPPKVFFVAKPTIMQFYNELYDNDISSMTDDNFKIKLKENDLQELLDMELIRVESIKDGFLFGIQPFSFLKEELGNKNK